MGIQIGDEPLGQFTDTELVAWMNDKNEGYTLRDKTARLWVAILRAFDEADPPMTVRQVYYALVSSGAIPKTEKAYNQTSYYLLQMRRRGVLPYKFIADNTRWMRKPRSYRSLETFLNISKDTYRRALWANQNVYVEIWCEKDALAGVIYDVTEEWDVPLMVTRGFPSETFVYEAAETLKGQDNAVHIYFFGDHDPSGVSIAETVEKRLGEFGATFQFEVVAVLPWQIDTWGLPTRPTKRTDTRAKGWQGGSVELDAISAATLRQLVRNCIIQHVDEWALQETQRAERLERETLETVISNLGLA